MDWIAEVVAWTWRLVVWFCVAAIVALVVFVLGNEVRKAYGIEIDWETVRTFALVAYFIVSCLLAILTFIFVWVLAIFEKGIVWGVLLGSATGFIAAIVVLLVWPIIAIVVVVLCRQDWFWEFLTSYWSMRLAQTKGAE
jgi:small-conductance mechanosensitive channel